MGAGLRMNFGKARGIVLEGGQCMRAKRRGISLRGRRSATDAQAFNDLDVFARRTWKEASDRICWANSLPPGFRIVLLDEGGRTWRSTLMIESGDFGAFPRSWRVWSFLKEAVATSVKDWNGL